MDASAAIISIFEFKPSKASLTLLLSSSTELSSEITSSFEFSSLNEFSRVS